MQYGIGARRTVSTIHRNEVPVCIGGDLVEGVSQSRWPLEGSAGCCAYRIKREWVDVQYHLTMQYDFARVLCNCFSSKPTGGVAVLAIAWLALSKKPA